MAKLVECLVAGIAGAASGTATFVLRGTASSAASVLYNDFEMTAQPGTNIITLDSNGCAEVYVNAYCDMTLKTQAGATLRTVTVGDSATTVECISDSFTGVDYSGAPTAVSEPITLAAVLDKWNNSAGSIDWKVLVGGVSTNLSSAIAAFSGMFVNVKDPTYGAVGNGVTDDTTAISNAITAAAGGIVFFPPGTYNVTGLTISQANFYLLGSGSGVSIISCTQAGDQIFAITDTTLAGFKRVECLSFDSTATVNQIFELVNGGLTTTGQNISFNKCQFDMRDAPVGIYNPVGASKATIHITDCVFVLDDSSNSAVWNAADVNKANISISNCYFYLTANNYTSIVLRGCDMVVTGCEFNALAVSSSYTMVNPESQVTTGTYTGSFVGNKFIDGGSGGYCFSLSSVLANSCFTEYGNTFIGYSDPTTLAGIGTIYNFSVSANHASTNRIFLGGRIGRQLSITHAATTGTMNCCVAGDTLVINYTAAGNLTLTPSSSCMTGTIANIVVLNNSSATRTITVEGSGGQSVATTSVVDGGRAIASIFHYLETTGAESAQVITAIDLRTAT